MFECTEGCTACGACAIICPQNCISLVTNNKGFLTPIVDKSKCIDCGLCNKVCHLRKDNITITDQKAYAAVCESDAVLAQSTSGGAFSAIAKYVFNEGGVVYGCVYDKHLQVIHKRINNLDDLKKINGSKYVQSNLKNTYAETKKDLQAGKTVLFSGTPCQVAGLKAYLNKDFENLITVDIICHGVAPQAYFDKYVKWFEQKNQVILSDYNFRAKANSGWSLAGICEGTTINTNKLVKRKVYYSNEFYYFFFLRGTIYQEGCYVCKYANLNRPSDYTLGDLWGAESLDLSFDITKGCSLVLANNAKAIKLLRDIQMIYEEINLDNAVKNNKQLSEPSEKSVDRDMVVDLFANSTSEKIDKYFRKKYLLDRIKGKMKYLLPPNIKDIIKRAIR